MNNLQSIDSHSIAVDDQLSVLGFHGTIKPTMSRVILEQVGLQIETKQQRFKQCNGQVKIQFKRSNEYD